MSTHRIITMPGAGTTAYIVPTGALVEGWTWDQIQDAARVTLDLPADDDEDAWDNSAAAEIADAGWRQESPWTPDGSALVAEVTPLRAIAMTDAELDAWLGDARADLTDQQYEQLVAEVGPIAFRYSDVDDADAASAAQSAALQFILGEITLEQAGRALLTARRAAAEALAAARQVARMAALAGTPKARAAREAGIDRMTLLKDLGER